MIGDLILLYGTSKGSPPTRAFQALAAGQPIQETPSHVAMITGSHRITHAVPSGVECALIYELIDLPQPFQIFRHKKFLPRLMADREVALSFLMRVEECASEGYNFAVPVLAEIKDRSFCSELVVQLFSIAGLYPFGGLAQKILPAHIAKYIRQDEADWQNVTHTIHDYRGSYHDFSAQRLEVTQNPDGQRAYIKAKRLERAESHMFRAAFDEATTHGNRQFAQVWETHDRGVQSSRPLEDVAKVERLSPKQEALCTKYRRWLSDSDDNPLHDVLFG